MSSKSTKHVENTHPIQDRITPNRVTGERNIQEPWQPIRAKITGIDEEIPNVKTYYIETFSGEFQTHPIRPGQFNMIYVPGIGESAISASSIPDDGTLVHTIRAVGNVTNTLANMNVGDTLAVRGPFGSSWPMDQCREKNVVIAAGGIGLAPLRPVVESICAEREKFERVHVLMGAQTPEDMLFADDFPAWRDAGVTVYETVDRPNEDWDGHVGYVPPLLNEIDFGRPENTVVMTCGPEIMMHLTLQAALRLGVPFCQLWITMERNMKCAIGHCGHCQFGPHFICKDGPVLRYDRVDTLLSVADL